jgi:hypothetical protein
MMKISAMTKTKPSTRRTPRRDLPFSTGRRCPLPNSACFPVRLLLQLAWTLIVGLIANLVVCGNSQAQAALLFSQDFSASSDVSHYVSSNPDSGQWNSIYGASITDGALTFSRGSSAGSFTRSTDLSPAPSAFIYTLTLNVGSSTSKASPAAVVQVGSGFSPTLNGVESSDKVHSQFGINFSDYTGGHTFRDLKTLTDSSPYVFSAKHKLTWVVNNSTETVEYLAPNNTMRSVSPDHWDLWCGFYSVFLGSSAANPDQSLTDLKFVFGAGTGTIALDNFNIQTIGAVPEPAATGPLALAFLGTVVGARFVKRWIRPAPSPNQASNAG